MIDDKLIISERVYLSKNPDVYVQSSSLQHYQAEDIRFLFKQHVTKKPGVIFKESVKNENSFQVTLFISAIVGALEKPVLILCDENDMGIWSDHFQNIQSNNDIAINESNIFLERKIFIISKEKLDSYHRREWSVIVVSDDSFLQYKQIHPKYKADYKIWLTTIDIKDDLGSFSLVYKWFYPKKELDVEELKVDKADIREKLSKVIRIEASLEDMVLSRSNILTSSKTFQYQPVNRVSRKNKDATGTKIKRSRKVSVDNIDKPTLKKKNQSSVTNDYTNNNRIENNGNSSNIQSDVRDKSNEDAENFIYNNEHTNDYEVTNPEISNILRRSAEKPFNELDVNIEKDATMEIRTNNISQDFETEDMHLNYSDENISQQVHEKEAEENMFVAPMDIDSRKENCLVTKDEVSEFEIDNSNDTCKNNNEDDIKVNVYEAPMDIDSKKDFPVIGEEIKEFKVDDTNSTALHNETNVKSSNFDTKLEELEEKVMKKFKGSLLDSIF
ncbi:uncharacterized protein LOC131852486 [Achroia grisella]|uniref:uncharacterized protein LOC131852486 n=1 Tax=Achroia grisella TaxID=688607 RepID=UPI0027D26E08|nr:uncharacterized protein LOC131852486 [Achroia grisella]